jgi:hypothetical protein
MKKATKHALEKLRSANIQRYKIYKTLEFGNKSLLYALSKLIFAKILCYTVWKR